ncbi:flagellar basal-body rod protein FlgF [Oxalobacteraceae bacterium CAVE-383]|nr:flagellar basal-body rod protein FlgF [Oxalobacteraceae bacterium CAVE-383]
MDKVIYTAMGGASHTMEQQANVSNNLANASTTAFKAQLNTFRAVPLVGDGLATRTYVVDSTIGNDFTNGGLQQTGRALDIAVNGDGWLAVQAPDGTEAYTRAGDLKINENGVLQTQNGLNVLGDTGPITFEPQTSPTIASDGTVSTISLNGTPNAVNIVGRLKLVNPPPGTLVRGDDGLFRQGDGADADADANVTVSPGMLESSNVNPIEAMVEMINLSRQFDLHTKMLSMVESNETKATSIMTL